MFVFTFNSIKMITSQDYICFLPFNRFINKDVLFSCVHELFDPSTYLFIFRLNKTAYVTAITCVSKTVPPRACSEYPWRCAPNGSDITTFLRPYGASSDVKGRYERYEQKTNRDLMFGYQMEILRNMLGKILS